MFDLFDIFAASTNKSAVKSNHKYEFSHRKEEAINYLALTV